ncbi:hypothetical protein M408DRAFT_27677 [Serendipita vermifera MAFF 305830]|uniref:Dynamin N-terminal domain-containing protein n=1 Tax=Serendipita vermifera MAFF 305830 TaxID=933852 RepID=A0A0C2X2Q3_SERVB|nr:hypothetical protein M408DRAFT_27677 [Serendipita vermifera MAFF 305830]
MSGSHRKQEIKNEPNSAGTGESALNRGAVVKTKNPSNSTSSPMRCDDVTLQEEASRANVAPIAQEHVDCPTLRAPKSIATKEISPLITFPTDLVRVLDRGEESTDPLSAPTPVRPTFPSYNGPEEILYTPESVLDHGLAMVKTAEASISELDVTNRMRLDVWKRDLQRLKTTSTQKTMIALSTGAGKSSVINALLDHNIVPTSGMRACTATVTEIAYHRRSTIDANIEFLTTDEWRAELLVLQGDLRDDDGNFKRDKRTNAGVAWHKVHAVYPGLTAEQLVEMTVDKIIASDKRVLEILDTTKKLRCPNSHEFTKEITKYVDSKNPKRSEKKDKKKGKDGDDPEYWPLIKQVKVWVKAEALSTGAVLCDLPGAADSNVARSNIAKEYMKHANCIWILAPIQRAVDDKTAKDLLGEAFKAQLLMDGNYDGSTITFIATKADDISASEVIRALGLDEDPQFESIRDRVEVLKKESKTAKKLKESASNRLKSLDQQIKRHQAIKAELEDHLRCLRTRKNFIPHLTAKQKRSRGDNPKKRKALVDDSRRNTKRRRIEDSDLESNMDTHSSSESDQESSDLTSIEYSDEPTEDSDVESYKDGDVKMKARKSRSNRSGSRMSTNSGSKLSTVESPSGDSDSDEDPASKRKRRTASKKRNQGYYDHEGSDIDSTDGSDDVETETSLKSKIYAEKAIIENFRSKVVTLKEQRKDANNIGAKTRKERASLQKEKNAFCALKRAEFSRDVLKADFRCGLRDLDETAALERDNESDDSTVPLRDYGSSASTVPLRDYDAIHLPVFCVSARDYARIHKLNRGDGSPSTFSDETQTEIPSLRAWCQDLTVASRERTAKMFLDAFKVFAQSVLSYVEVQEGISNTDRNALRAKWQTPAAPEPAYESDGDASLGLPNESGSDYRRRIKPSRKGFTGELIGISALLDNKFEAVVDSSVENLRERFGDGLQSKCAEGVQIATSSALRINDRFAGRTYWVTYRATLRRDGTFHEDLNELLCAPLTKKIASSWAQVFEANLFTSIDQRVLASVRELLKRVEMSITNIDLREKCQSQGELAVQEAEVELRKLVSAVSQLLQNQQKDISRCIAPKVKKRLHEAYSAPLRASGRGSVAFQKKVFRDLLKDLRNEIFVDCASNLFSQLEDVSIAVRDELDFALTKLAQKIEVNLSILWEGGGDTQKQRAARKDMLEISRQITFWQAAARTSGASG